MQFWQDLLYKYQVAPPPSGAFSKGAPYGPFSTKRLGMAIDGSYTIAQFRTVQDLAWDIALPPIGPKGRIALIKGAPGHSLPTHSAHSEQAWAFLSWWIRNQTAEMVVLPGNLPSKLSALRGWVTYQQQKYPTPQHIGLVYDIATKYGKSLQVLPNNAVVKKPYYAERALILQNSEDAKTGMTRACQQMSILLKQA
jgi:ABC-type glycerol-3-phosphate transport system substrate-binding protein